MKTTIIFIFGLLVLLSCSKDNPYIEPCFFYGAIVTDNCDCIDYNSPCIQRHYSISQTEYDKLLGILNASTKPCVYVDSSEFWDSKDGYLIRLIKDVCPDIKIF